MRFTVYCCLLHDSIVSYTQFRSVMCNIPWTCDLLSSQKRIESIICVSQYSSTVLASSSWRRFRSTLLWAWSRFHDFNYGSEIKPIAAFCNIDVIKKDLTQWMNIEKRISAFNTMKTAWSQHENKGDCTTLIEIVYKILSSHAIKNSVNSVEKLHRAHERWNSIWRYSRKNFHGVIMMENPLSMRKPYLWRRYFL